MALLRDKPTRMLRRHAQTVAINVLRPDWPPISTGTKTEFRSYRRSSVRAPCPVLLYSVHPQTGRVEQQMAVLEQTWREPLGAISEESLEREGFETLADFRRYMRHTHEQLGYRPLNIVQVYRLRLWRLGDEQEWGVWLLRRLYPILAGDDIAAE